MIRHPAVEVTARGDRYLRLATALLQWMRLSWPDGGVWEAADVQWWWRAERPTDRPGQLFWLDRHGDPVAAVILTDFFHGIQCDVLVPPGDGGFARTVWRAALGRVNALGLTAGFPLRSDDAVGLAELTGAGLRPAGAPGVLAAWLDAGHRPPVPDLPPGYRLLSRADDQTRPHPLAARNGPRVESRLGRCGLYRAGLDLAVLDPAGQVAGYGLFWADPVTRVGLVEPMRTEDAHQRRGIARHILACGLDRLAASGCLRLKVMNDIPLYLRAGFQPVRTPSLLTYNPG